MDLMIDNLKNNSYPYDTHAMTGPTVFTKAINQSLKENPNINHKIYGIDFNGCVKFSFNGSKTALYGVKGKSLKISKQTPVINNELS